MAGVHSFNVYRKFSKILISPLGSPILFPEFQQSRQSIHSPLSPLPSHPIESFLSIEVLVNLPETERSAVVRFFGFIVRVQINLGRFHVGGFRPGRQRTGGGRFGHVCFATPEKEKELNIYYVGIL